MEKLKTAIVASSAFTSISFILSTLFYHIAITRTPSFHLALRGDVLGEISLSLIPTTLVFSLSTVSLSMFALTRLFAKKLKKVGAPAH